VDARVERWLSALEATIRKADESFSEIDMHESEHNTALIKKYTEKLAEIATTVADAAAVAKAGRAKQDELTKLAAELRATKDGLKEEFALRRLITCDSMISCLHRQIHAKDAARSRNRAKLLTAWQRAECLGSSLTRKGSSTAKMFRS
jgi:hypothetical protein